MQCLIFTEYKLELCRDRESNNLDHAVWPLCAGDFYPDDPESPDQEEPEWVASERKQFREVHDADHDGKMSKAEIMKWIVPDDYDHVEAESQHLIQQADADKVCCLNSLQAKLQTEGSCLEKTGKQVTHFWPPFW